MINYTLFFFAILFTTSYSQIASNSDIYDFLESMRFKGIVAFNSEIKPVSKKELAQLIKIVDSNKDKLTELESELLERFKIEFEPEIRFITNSSSESQLSFLRTEKHLRLFEYYSSDFSFYADPVISLEAGSFYDKSFFMRRNGFSIYGFAGENWSYSLRFFDNEESGNNLDKTKRLTRKSAVSITKEKQKSFEYDVVTANVEYRWSTGAVSINKDYLSFGSGNFGKIILSDKAPPFTFVRFDLKPVDWLSFFYFHGFLQSNVPDSSTLRYNAVPGRTSIIEVPKFMAFHSLSFYPTDNVSIIIGESIIYSEKIQPIYFIPVIFFRAADHYLGTDNASATGNAQMFADFSYLNRELKTKIYSTVFIDELSLNRLFEGENLSAIGFTAGIELYNIFPQTKLFIEYSRINPFVYMNSVDAQLYSNDGQKMGHWIESNGDIISVGIKKFIKETLKTELNAWYFRKGKTEEPVEQYRSPYPSFLYGSKRYETGFEMKVYYSPIIPLSIGAEYLFTNISDEETFRTQTYKIGKRSSFIIKLSYQM